MGRFDTSGKYTIHLYARAWAEWIVDLQQLEITAELSGEFQFIARATDVLLKVKNEQAEEFLSLTDLQLQYDDNMDRRLAAYAALAREKYRLEVHVAVVYLRPPPEGKSVARSFHKEFMGQIAHQDFQAVCLWELDAEAALALDNPALIPFIPLMKGGNSEQMFRRCVARVHQEPNAQELEMALAMFASVVMRVELIRQIVGWSMNILKESPLYQELTALAWEEGHEKGREEGREEGGLAILRSFLKFRYHVAEDHFDDRLNGLELEQIKQLSDLVAEADTLAEFENVLNQFIADNCRPGESSNTVSP
ncbi:MAG: hypothetical protein R3C14_33190 [Caldilineaceae bacterium]